MFRFLFGFAIVGAGIAGWNVWWRPQYIEGILTVEYLMQLLLRLCAAPLLGAAVAVVLIQCRGPRRLFVSGRRSVGPLVLGVVSGCLWLVLAVVAVAYGDRFLPDAVITGFAAIPTAAVVLVCCRRLRPGHCRRCDYDVRSSLPFGRCPECGARI